MAAAMRAEPAMIMPSSVNHRSLKISQVRKKSSPMLVRLVPLPPKTFLHVLLVKKLLVKKFPFLKKPA